MKKILLFALIAIAAFNSCKKEETDDRDQFVGTWKGTQTTTIPSISWSSTDPVVNIITKSSSNSDRLLITVDSDIMNATIKGSSYVYEEKTYIENIEGETATTVVNGTGSINGNQITETGTIVMSIYGESYSGTWVCTMIKQ